MLRWLDVFYAPVCQEGRFVGHALTPLLVTGEVFSSIADLIFMFSCVCFALGRSCEVFYSSPALRSPWGPSELLLVVFMVLGCRSLLRQLVLATFLSMLGSSCSGLCAGAVCPVLGGVMSSF